MLRSFLGLGAIARMRNVRSATERDSWMSALLARRPYKVAVVTVANKPARIAWALMVRGSIYREAAVRLSEERVSTEPPPAMTANRYMTVEALAQIDHKETDPILSTATQAA